MPPHLEVVEGLVREAVENQLLTPLPDEVIDEMRWYFEQALDQLKVRYMSSQQHHSIIFSKFLQ